MGHTKQPDKADFTPGDWQAWQLAPDSDPQERSIVVAGPDGETEICGIVNNPADVPLIACAKLMYETLIQAELQIEYMQEKFKQTGSGNAIMAEIQRVLQKARGQQ